ncbi:MAG: hypothetical protein KDD49_14120, partial [Bacteroidetes bacterium]|nr:hypothetical protein [Bacteroidota bacterium]
TAKKDFLPLLFILKLNDNSVNDDALPFSNTQSLFDFGIIFIKKENKYIGNYKSYINNNNYHLLWM